ncbi:MAG: peptidoglycan-binding domain-containing protein [Kiritimatiellales bacterium]
MATYSTLKYGSTGDEVKTLQQLLAEKAGYGGNVNGTFGTGTQAALKKYQQENGLTASGIADTDTWSKITAVDPVYATTPRGTQYDTATTTPTKADLGALEGSAPAAYNSPYTQQLDELYNQVMSRQDFSYDYAADPIYQQMSQRYQQQGKSAMQDTMANAATLTGGYGNSYGVAAGQQAYNEYLQGANDNIADLYSNARSQYNQQGSDMLNQLSALQGRESTAYNQYQGGVDDYYTQLAYYQQKAAQEQDQSNWQAEYDLANPAKSGSGSSGSSSRYSSSSSGGGTTPKPNPTPDTTPPPSGQASLSAATAAIRTITATEGQTAAYRAIKDMLENDEISEATAKALRNNGSIFKQGVTA